MGIEHVALFGSTARNDAYEDSDLDLAVKLRPDMRLGWDFFTLDERVAAVFRRRGEHRDGTGGSTQTASRDRSGLHRCFLEKRRCGFRTSLKTSIVSRCSSTA
ncbi:nucleotidyltransferase family protein [Sphingomonas cynarae]|uniref:nucleotidyltransferase family protein n=1 Tax=Sphingomonas cynarae TaxID=930197 RepID=UPI003CD07224